MLDWLVVFLLTIAPIFELRASIPYGLLVAELPFWGVMLLVFFANLLSAVIAYLFIKHLIPLFRKISWIDTLYKKWVIRTQKKVHYKVDKYGVLGLAIFIGIPLPGSGVWTGALASIILDIKFRNFFKASIIGILIAETIVGLATQSGKSLWGLI